jgi:hypothetical protein
MLASCFWIDFGRVSILHIVIAIIWANLIAEVTELPGCRQHRNAISVSIMDGAYCD